MAFAKDDWVGIRPVRDTGVVVLVKPSNVDYDINRDSIRATESFAEKDIFPLPDGSKERVHDRSMVIDGRGILFISVYKHHKSIRTVRTEAYRIRHGHNMGRVARAR